MISKTDPKISQNDLQKSPQIRAFALSGTCIGNFIICHHKLSLYHDAPIVLVSHFNRDILYFYLSYISHNLVYFVND